MKNKKRILVCDDDPDILEVMKIMLTDEGYTVGICDDESGIFKVIDSFAPDLLLLDIWMSKIDGREILKKLRSSDKNANIPVILVSALNETEMAAKETGANDFLKKPFEMSDLLSKVKKVTKEKTN